MNSPTINKIPDEAQEVKRDYLDEAERIIAGTTMLLAQREHLIALKKHYEKQGGER